VRYPDRERGAVAVLVAVAMVALIAMAGFALDIGAIYGDRTELSRGADAVALAVAEECLLDPSCDRDDLLDYALGYATGNSSNNTTGLDYFEIHHDARQVEVITGAITATSFLSVIGIDQSPVQARAVAEWGFLSSGQVAPWAFPDCVWNDHSPGGAEFIFAFENISTYCGGLTPPGGFGFLDVNNPSDCVAFAVVGQPESYTGDPGTDWPCSNEAKVALQGENGTGATILVLVHDHEEATGTGASGTYLTIGISAFKVTGYRLPGSGTPSWGADMGECPGSASACVRGYFTQASFYEGTTGGPDFGAGVVTLIE
jgi:hypothetical protein